MGDRCNVIFKQDNGCYLGFYHHNGGYIVKEMAAKALQAVGADKPVNDECYSTRIAISAMIGERWEQQYDYGLLAANSINDAIQDNERDVVVIDWAMGTVIIFDYHHFPAHNKIGKVSKTYTFNEFVKLFAPPVVIQEPEKPAGPELRKLNFVERCFYNEWITFEHDGVQHTRDLTNVTDNSHGFTGTFLYCFIEHVVTMQVSEGIHRITPSMSLDEIIALANSLPSEKQYH